jgi:hypothetical protein
VAWLLRGRRFSREPVPPTAPLVTGRVRTPRLVDSAAAGAAFGLLHDVELAVHAVDTVPHRLLRTGGVSARDVTASAAGWAPTPRTPPSCSSARPLPGSSRQAATCACCRRLTSTAGRARTAPPAGCCWPAAGSTPPAGSPPPPSRAPTRSGPEADASTAPPVRSLLLELAAALEPGTMPDLEELTQALAWHRPRLTRGPVDAGTLVDWTWREAGWLGLVALGGVSAFAASLDRRDAALPAELTALFPEPVREVILQADLTAVAPGPLAHDVAGELRLLAEQESRGGGGVYRFSDSSLRRAFDVGWSAAEVHAWLDEHSTTPVPQPLAYLVEDVARRHGSIRVGGALSYLRTDDATEAASLLGHPGAASLGLRAVAPGVLVAGVEPAELVAFLHGLGQTPAVEDEGGRTMTPPPGQRAPRPTGSEAPPSAQPEEVAAALLAAERNHPRRRDADDADSTERTLERLRLATQQAAPVWVAWVAADGSPTERQLAPLDLTGGSVRAVDRSSAQVVTIPLARISRVGAEPRRP